MRDANSRRRYIAERNRQNSFLLHPGGRAGSKLPDLVGRLPSVRDDVESAQDVELVVENGEATGQSRSPGHRAREQQPG